MTAESLREVLRNADPNALKAAMETARLIVGESRAECENHLTDLRAVKAFTLADINESRASGRHLWLTLGFVSGVIFTIIYMACCGVLK